MSEPYEQFQNLTLEDLERFVAEGREEDLRLEFKAFKDGKVNPKKAKKIFAEYASAFANSDGGLLVWGIDARKKDGVDAACERVPIEKLRQFISTLRGETSRSLDPPLTGIEHEKFPCGEDEGFVVTYIPKTGGGPHMAKLGVNKFYQRSEDSKYLMEYYHLAQMFGKRPYPKLELQWSYERSSRPYSARDVLTFTVSNLGRASAKEVVVIIESNEYWRGFVEVEDKHVEERLKRNIGFFRGENNNLISVLKGSLHPQSTIYVGKIFGEPEFDVIETRVERKVKPSLTAIAAHPPIPERKFYPPRDVQIKYKVFAEDMPPLVDELNITSVEMVKPEKNGSNH